MTEIGIAQRTDVHLRADISRVVTRLFVPGQELIGGSESRTSNTVQEVLALSEEDVDCVMADILERFSQRSAIPVSSDIQISPAWPPMVFGSS